MGHKHSKEACNELLSDHERQSFLEIYMKLKDQQGYIDFEKFNDFLNWPRDVSLKLFCLFGDKGTLRATRGELLHFLDDFLLSTRNSEQTANDLGNHRYHIYFHVLGTTSEPCSCEEFVSKVPVFNELQISKAEATEMFNNLIKISNLKPSRKLSKSLDNSIFGKCNSVTFPKWKIWFESNLPYAFKVLDVVLYTKFFCFDSLTLNQNLDISSDGVLSEDLLWIVKSSNPQVFVQWQKLDCRKLFSTSKSGYSISQLEHYLVGYPGKTLILVSAVCDNPLMNEKFNSEVLIFGAFVSPTWKVAKSYFGDAQTSIFVLYPFIETCKAQPTETNYVYWNASNGISFGGSVKNPRMKINPDMQSGFISNSVRDASFEKSTLDFDVSFSIEEIEVYGFSGEVGLKSWNREKEFDKKINSQRQSVHIPVDKMIFEWMGISGFSSEFK